jgi:hypothetical protein
MTRNMQSGMIAVDAETGTYWLGARALQTADEINAFIERQKLKAQAKQEERVPGYSFCGHALQ